MTKFLLDSGDPQEYKEIAALAKQQGSELWGSTTNPSLVAKKIAASGKKLSPQEAFALQKEIVLEIIAIVPGAVSGEVYADHTTTAEEMAKQGRDIASWHSRVVVKLPTTLEGFKARTLLRKEGIGINNTLVFSQQQIFAICLHEQCMNELYGPAKSPFPAFISPFIGRLDDKGEDGLSLLTEGMKIKNTYFHPDLTWMLAASIRSAYHVKKTRELQAELATVPAKIYREWFTLTEEQQNSLTSPESNLQQIPSWTPTEELLQMHTVEELMIAMDNGTLDITHPLTIAGIDKFVADWDAILQ